MRWRGYNKNKEGGVRWIGEIPEGWDIWRLRHIISEPLKYGANVSTDIDDTDLPRYVRITDVNENGGLREDTFRSLPMEIAVSYLLEEGDLLFARSGATSGKTFLYHRNWGVCAYAGYLIRARLNQKKVIPAYIKYFTNSTTYWQWLSSIYIQATIQNVSAEKYADLQIPLPPIIEQSAIADFLDRETGRLDTLIAKKQALIGLLKEKRTALISQTVTRGLPADAAREFGLEPHIRFKDSGIEWLGDLPGEWKVLPFTKYVAERSDYRGKTPEKTDSGIFLVTAKNVRMGYIDYEVSKEYVAEEDYDDIMRRGLPKIGDILFTTEAPLGNIALVDREEVAMAQRIIRFRMEPKRFLSKFALYGMISDYFQSQLRSLSTGSTAEGLKASKLSLLRLICPPLDQQKAIASFLDRETQKTDNLIAKVETAITRLQEYRTALITAAVTGKIDVRHHASKKEAA